MIEKKKLWNFGKILLLLGKEKKKATKNLKTWEIFNKKRKKKISPSFHIFSFSNNNILPKIHNYFSLSYIFSFYTIFFNLINLKLNISYCNLVKFDFTNYMLTLLNQLLLGGINASKMFLVSLKYLWRKLKYSTQTFINGDIRPHSLIF